MRLEPSAVLRDPQGRAICAPCRARLDGATQDQKALTVYLLLVLGGSLLLVLLVFVVIGIVVYRATVR